MDTKPAGSELKEDIKFLLETFKVERYIYLVLTIISIILLGFLVKTMFDNDEIGTKELLTLLGPSGLITLTFSRILKMWTDCIDLIKTSIANR